MRIPVPHFQQATPHSCLPACIRMVLAFLGAEYSEKQLSQALRTAPGWGTLPEHIEEPLTNWGYHVRWFENATLERLEQLQENNFPVIVFLRSSDLPHGVSGMHAVVVIDVSDTELLCLDPMLDHDLVFPIGEFLRTWSRLGNQGIVIWR